MTGAVKLARLASGYGLLEGARWYPEHGLVFSDMTAGGVYRLPPGATGPETLIPHRKAIGGLVAHADGGFVVSGRNVSIKGDDGTTTVLLEAAADEQFFNDITADGRGRLFAGSLPKNAGSGRAAARLTGCCTTWTPSAGPCGSSSSTRPTSAARGRSSSPPASTTRCPTASRSRPTGRSGSRWPAPAWSSAGMLAALAWPRSASRTPSSPRSASAAPASARSTSSPEPTPSTRTPTAAPSSAWTRPAPGCPRPSPGCGTSRARARPGGVACTGEFTQSATRRSSAGQFHG